MARAQIGGYAALTTALFLTTGGLAAAQPFALTVEGGVVVRLHRFNLETAAVEAIAELPAVAIAALDQGPGGLVYGLDARGIEPSRLVAIHPETGVLDVVGELAISDPTGLAFAPDGQLWVVGGQSLHRVDRATAATLESLVVGQELHALAGSADQLYGVGGSWSLWTVDTASGDLTLVADLPLLGIDWLDADVDAAGAMWILGRGSGPIMGLVTTGLYQLPDPATGEVNEVFSALYNIDEEDPRARIGGLTVPATAIVAVPALDGVGMTLLAALLAVAAVVALRRRRSPV